MPPPPHGHAPSAPFPFHSRCSTPPSPFPHLFSIVTLILPSVKVNIALLAGNKMRRNLLLGRPSLLPSLPLLLLALLLLLLPLPTNSARFCYSGQNSRYAQKHCSSGSLDVDYVCQKYTCEGGRSPFVLRTCALKTTGCLAGPRICKFSGGRGRCDKCDVPFIFRDCSTELNCTLADELCTEYDGNGTCAYCYEDFCNEQGSILNMPIMVVDGSHEDSRIIPYWPMMLIILFLHYYFIC